MLCRSVVGTAAILLAAICLAASQPSELFEHIQEIDKFIEGAVGFTFPTSAAETPEQEAIATYCGLGHYNASASDNSGLSNLLFEISYKCGQDASTVTPNKPSDVTKAGDPDTSEGTSLRLKKTILSNQLITMQIYAFACNFRNHMAFLRTVQYAASMGYTLNGGYPAKAHFIEQLYKPTPEDTLSASLGGQPKTLKPGSDTEVFVAQLNLDSQKNTALFLFHATTGNNYCHWATDANYFQVPYPTPEGLTECKGCKVHQGWLAAFDTITDPDNPSSNILVQWEELTGVPAAEVTEVFCIGHSMGAALASLCGPWARSTFPNAATLCYASGSPRLFSPEVSDWWDWVIGPGNSYRIVNNMDFVPSLPAQLDPGNGNLGVLKFEHVGAPIWLYREGKNIPGSYTAFAHPRPVAYTGSTYDHLHGYILGLKQVTACNY